MSSKKDRVDEYINKYQALKGEREASIESISLDVSEYIVPSRGRFPGDDKKPDRMHGKRGSKIFDPTARNAHSIANNGMHSGLTPPSRPWFRVGLQDEDLGDWGPVKGFFDALQRRLYAQFRRSNFYSCMHSGYGEVLAFANNLIAMREFIQGGFHFKPFTFGEYWWARNERGNVDTVYRTEWMYAIQMIERFGIDKVSSRVRDAMEGRNKKPYLPVELLHVVQPRSDYDPSRKDALNMAYESIWIEMGNDRAIVSESGFETFPYAAGSWLLVGSDQYGCDSPGMQILPDVKMLQDLEESSLIATHLELDPSMLVPASLLGSPIRKTAGGVTFYDGQPEGIRRLFEFKFDIAAGEAKAQAVRDRIRHGYYNDIFMMILQNDQKGNITATQILEMQGEKMLQLGPFIERQEDEILDKLVVFAVERMIKRPWLYDLPPLPEELEGADYKVEYISLLAQAQQMIGIRAIDDTVRFATAAAQITPEILDNYNMDELAQERARLVGLPGSGVRSAEELEQIRKQRAEEQRAMQQAQVGMAAVEGAKKLGDTPYNPEKPSVLTELMSGLGGGA